VLSIVYKIRILMKKNAKVFLKYTKTSKFYIKLFFLKKAAFKVNLKHALRKNSSKKGKSDLHPNFELKPKIIFNNISYIYYPKI